ncbi:Neurotransmitter-gated ion-channel transmembrane region, variant 2 [Dermatophagoides farinae]|uniref:Neurotransmitter-gated ion-channel transmembrane region, variant 2 n=1 Tax=Dermatophagoides farinae TaxID=6954 RepID=A0A922KYG5_DERFA|nr:Neurotransmitter-gated ion-channel transmembrane region, variant 2 [Dermatophagoides farinae]
MTSNVWINLRWPDYQLTWDPADYGGITVLQLPPDKVWKPDVVLFNNADGNYEVRFKSNTLLSYNGELLWLPPAIYQSSCQIDVTYFPFDQQRCVMKFGSWTFNGDQVYLGLINDRYSVDLSDYWKSGTWDIVDVPAYINVYNNSKYGKPTETDISFYITLRRKTLFYTVNLILPTVLISFLSILVFYLPSEAGEKVTLGISILLALVVFLLLISKILPPTSLALPLIAKYLLFAFIMNCISILATVIVINWNFRGPRTHKMPNWVRTVFLTYLPALLFMKRPKKTRLRWMMDMPNIHHHYHHYHQHHHQQQQQQQQQQQHHPSQYHFHHHHSHHHNQMGGQTADTIIPSCLTGSGTGPPDEMVSGNVSPTTAQPQPITTTTSTAQRHHHHPNCTIVTAQQHQSNFHPPLQPHHSSHHHPHQPQPPPPPPSSSSIDHDMMAIRDNDSLDLYFMSPDAYRAAEAIEFIAEHLRNEDQYIQIREDWKYVAMVIDRLQLYLFFGITSFGTIAILLDAPHIFQPIDQDKVIQMNRHESS